MNKKLSIALREGLDNLQAGLAEKVMELRKRGYFLVEVVKVRGVYKYIFNKREDL